jgi:AcrR family transcriptional regulator
MSPRPYRMERRRESTDENRLRIINAARELLATRDLYARFSVEEVARRAGVARMTIYHQFGSLGGLLEGLCDSLAMAGGMSNLGEAFRRAEPLEALDHFISVFMRFWESDRPVLRGLRALAARDPEFAAVLEERSGWRRKGLQVLLGRLAKQAGRPKQADMNDVVDLVYTLTDFGVYDSLASPGRTVEQVTRMVQRLARQVLA